MTVRILGRIVGAVLGTALGVAVGASSALACNGLAHKGDWQNGATENGMPAYAQAVADGADWIDSDLRGIQRGAIVVMHNSRLDATTTSSGPVADLTVKQARAVRLNDGSRLPFVSTFMRFLSENRDVHALVEIKQFNSIRHYRRLAYQIRRFSDEAQVVITSFDPDALKTISRFLPDVPRGIISGKRLYAPRISRYGASGIAVNIKHFRWFYAKRMARHGIQVYVWTVNDPTRWDGLANNPNVTLVITDEIQDYVARECVSDTDSS